MSLPKIKGPRKSRAFEIPIEKRGVLEAAAAVKAASASASAAAAEATAGAAAIEATARLAATETTARATGTRTATARTRTAFTARTATRGSRLARQKTFALQFLASQLAGAAHGFRLFARSLFRRFLEMSAKLHFTEDALAL
jgi:hypothetical protein